MKPNFDQFYETLQFIRDFKTVEYTFFERYVKGVLKRNTFYFNIFGQP